MTRVEQLHNRGFGEEIFARADALAAISELPGMITRRFLTAEHSRVNRLVGDWMRGAGMHVHVDAAANVVGRYEGVTPGLPALIIGSHLDTVADAGKYDGTLGVLTGISAVAALHTRHERLPFAIEVIGFGDEEGLRYRSTFLGSCAVAGTFDMALLERRDADGISMREAFEAFGLAPEKIGEATRKRGDLVGYVEVHIEQGPVLENEALPVGVVTSIAGATRLDVNLRGTAGHAGTVPMRHRQDALAGAAELVRFVETRCTKGDLVGTVGQLTVQPGAVNVIPGEVEFTVDVRAPDDAPRETAVEDIMQRIREVAACRNLTAGITKTYETASCPCSANMSLGIADAVSEVGFAPRYLPSGAGHDAMAMADITDVGMLFVRCAGGVSHNPEEAMTMEDADIATRVLLAFLRRHLQQLEDTG
ncbi:MAG: allantoate amidohydrolase [Gammaproteobacteria bacterium]|nr:allantoate amidohydrolase [Gammaproteobacteria bacterium]